MFVEKGQLSILFGLYFLAWLLKGILRAASSFFPSAFPPKTLLTCSIVLVNMVTAQRQTAASWETKGSIQLVEKEVPNVQPGQVLIRVAASGLCGMFLSPCECVI